MNKITINNIPVVVKEYQGQRVVTLKDIDTVHGRPDGTAKRNFTSNREHFIEGEDFFIVKPSDIQKDEIRTSEINNRGTVLITESGYLMLVKSFTDDLAWSIQRQLVKTYFRVKTNRTETPEIEIKKAEIQTEKARLLMQISNVETLSLDWKNIIISKAVEMLTGEKVLPLPKSEKTYSAAEIGEMFGVSAQKIGRIAKTNNMKIPEYGEWYKDKSPYCSKEVDSFRYNEKAIEEFKKLFN